MWSDFRMRSRPHLDASGLAAGWWEQLKDPENVDPLPTYLTHVSSVDLEADPPLILEVC